LAQLLKEQTAPVHEAVEARLDLLDPELTTQKLTNVVERLYGFWAGTEPAIDNWATNEPEAATALQWARRRRVTHFADDLAALGVDVTAVATAPVVFQKVTRPDVLGWLYVTEGSTLGGAVITRHLDRLAIDTRPLGAQPRLRSFSPYDEGPGPMWRAYQSELDRYTAEAKPPGDVVDAAVATFQSLYDWIEFTSRPVPTHP
jgi:heme oxygenase